jgi:N-methylhydantoinase B
VLQKASYSPNIKERRDFSCAVFDAAGRMVAQAAHIPVHLGSMPLSVAAAIRAFPNDMIDGDVIILNDPFRGGTHLPDITLVSPVFYQDSPQAARLCGFVASRAHHADVGGMVAGSMPVARELYQEGLIIPPVKFCSGGAINQGVFDLILANVRTPQERAGDLWAQLAANQRGAIRLKELLGRYGVADVATYMATLLDYTEHMTRRLLADLPDGVYHFTDYLDNDGVAAGPVKITVALAISGESAVVDFTGSALQQQGSLNAVYAITLSAVYYVFRCLLGLDVPNNAGCLAPITVIAPEGSIVNALPPAAVAGGNVETSQRLVDVLLGALAQAVPERIPAASQGTMNNLIIGGYDFERRQPFAYYETIAGGMGASQGKPGPSGLHSHMTNTLNTPVEALEYAYPLRVVRYEIRRGSGGLGRSPGGDGLRRDLLVLTPATLTLLTERRAIPPYGLAGGAPGAPGANWLVRNGEVLPLPGKGSCDLLPGDVVSLRTPGGGGYGAVDRDCASSDQ